MVNALIFDCDGVLADTERYGHLPAFNHKLAMERLDVDCGSAVVIEDSFNGLRAATAAGLPCLITVNDYTRDDDCAAARLVVDSLGDPGMPAQTLLKRTATPVADEVSLLNLEACLGATSATGGAR